MGPRASRPPSPSWPACPQPHCPRLAALPVPFRALRRWIAAAAPSPITGSLQDVPDVVLQLIIEWGSLTDIARWAAVDRRCLAVVLSEDLWRALCSQRLQVDNYRSLGLRSFCSAFHVHHCHASLLGVWQVMDDFPYGDLLQLAWRNGCLEATSLHAGNSTLFRISFEEEDGGDDNDGCHIAMSTRIGLHWRPGADDDGADVPWSPATWEMRAYQVAGAMRHSITLNWNTAVDTWVDPPLRGPPDQLLAQAMQSCSTLCMTLCKVPLVPDTQKPALVQAAAAQAYPSDVPRAQQLPLPGLYSGHYGYIYGLRAVEFVHIVYLPLPGGFCWTPSRDHSNSLLAALDRVCSAARPAATAAKVGAKDEWWLVALKATGDEHVPLGEVSFRVKVSGEAPGPQEAGSLAVWAGQGQMALPGFKGAYWTSGLFRLLPHGECCFDWSTGAHFSVQYTPVHLAV